MLLLLFLTALFVCSQSPGVHAQSIGGPILTESHRKFTLGFNTAYARSDIFGVRNTSSRFLFKGIYGFGEKFDLFGKFGVAKLELRAPQAETPDFSDDYHLAFGGGFTYRYLTLPSLRMSLFLSGQLFRFTSNPASERRLVLGGVSVTQVTEFEYDWREADASLGFIERLGNLKLYGGLTGKVIHRLESRIMRNIIGGSESAEAPEKGEYRSGPQISPFLGIDIMLRSNYFISAEIITKGRNDFLITFAISQTGKP